MADEGLPPREKLPVGSEDVPAWHERRRLRAYGELAGPRFMEKVDENPGKKRSPADQHTGEADYPTPS